MPLLALIFLVIPIAELFVIVRSAQAFGVGETLVVLVAISVLGAWLVRHEGLGIWRRFQRQLAAGELPHREMVDGVLVLVAGALLLTPGFITDVIGLLILLPPTRALLRAAVLSRARTNVDTFVFRGAPGGFDGTAGGHRPRHGMRDVRDVRATDADGSDGKVDGGGPAAPDGRDGPDEPPALGRP